MSRKNNIDDKMLKYLLSFNKENPYSKKIEEKTDAAIDLFFKDKEERSVIDKNRFKIILSPVPAISAAIIIFAFIFVLAFLNFSGLKYPIVADEISAGSMETKIIKKTSELKTSANETINLKTAGAQLLLKEKSLLLIKRNIFSFGKSSDTFYVLKSGTVSASVARHDNSANFTIDTPYGCVKVIGTEFQVSVLPDNFIVACYRGTVEISSKLFTGIKIINGGEQINVRIKENSTAIEKTEKSNEDKTAEDKIKSFNIQTEQKQKSLDNKNEKKYPAGAKTQETSDEKSVLESDDNAADRRPLSIWRTALDPEKYDKIFDFETCTGILTENTLLILDAETGAIIKKFPLPEKAANFYSYKDKLSFFVPPDNYYIYKMPEFKIIFSINAGPVNRGTPYIDDTFLAAASSDGNLYVYDHRANKLISKYNFNSALDCAPLILGDYVIVTDGMNRIYAYSISSGKIIWDYKGINRFNQFKPVTDDLDRFIAVTDEKNRGYVFNIITGNLINSFDIDDGTQPLFINNQLLICSNESLKLYGKFGRMILRTEKIGGIKGFFRNKNALYILNDRNVFVYHKRSLYNIISFSSSYQYLQTKNYLYVLENNKSIIKYRL